MATFVSISSVIFSGLLLLFCCFSCPVIAEEADDSTHPTFSQRPDGLISADQDIMKELLREEEEEEGEEYPWITLTKHNWYDVIEAHTHVAVAFVTRSSGCVHCQEFPSVLYDAAQDVQIDDLVVAYVDCDRDRKICEKYETDSGGEILLFSEGLGIYRYSEKLAVREWLIDFLTKHTRTKYFEGVSAEEFADLVKTEPIMVVGVFKDTPAGEKARGSFTRAAGDLFTKYPFYVFDWTAEVEKTVLESVYREDLQSDFVIALFKPIETASADVFDESVVSRRRIEEWVVDNAPALIEQHQRNTAFFDNHFVKKLPLVTLYLEESDDKLEERKQQLLMVARNFRDRAQFTYRFVDDESRDDLKRFGMESFPDMLGEDFSEGGVFLYGQVDDNDLHTTNSYIAWTEKLISRQLSAFVAKQKAPEDAEQGLVTKYPCLKVKTVVYDNYRKIVLDRTKDVFVYFYLSEGRCPPCDDFEPHFQKFAEHFAGRKDVVIGKMDMYLNERAPGNYLQNYPTLQLFQIEDKWHPKTFSGPRDAESMIKWGESVLPVEEDEHSHDDQAASLGRGEVL